MVVHLRFIPLLLLAALPGCSVINALRTSEPAPAIDVAAQAEPSWMPIGRTPGGRDILARTVGGGPRRIYVVGGIHGDEPEGLPVAQSLAQVLGASVLLNSTVRIVGDMNPDGSAAGTRSNASGVDLNRNWPAKSFRAGKGSGAKALAEAETAAVHADIAAFKPDVIVVFHSSQRGPFVNYDGPAAAAAHGFARAARECDPRWRVVPDMGYPTPGSIGQLFGVDKRVPILTIEFQRGRDTTTNTRAVAAGLGAIASTQVAAGR